MKPDQVKVRFADFLSFQVYGEQKELLEGEVDVVVEGLRVRADCLDHPEVVVEVHAEIVLQGNREVSVCLQPVNEAHHTAVLHHARLLQLTCLPCLRRKGR